MTIKGAGMGQTIIDCTGLRPTFGKGVLVPQADGCVVSDLSLTGASISQTDGGNAAGVRYDSPFGGTLTRVEIFGCQNGILGGGGPTLSVSECHFHDNGSGIAGTHEIYVNAGPLATFTDNVIVTGAGATHALKSRAGHTVVNGGTYTGSSDPTALIGGSVMDFPDGGPVEVTGAVIVVSAGAQMVAALGYAMEGGNNGVSPVNLTNVLIDNRNAQGAVLVTNKPGVTLNLTGCTFKGPAPQLQGFATVNGAFTPAP